MQRLINLMSNQMSADLKSNFKKLFIQAYKSNNYRKAILTLDDIKHELSYESLAQVPKTSIHIGQRKLFLSELNFFSQYVPSNKKIICVYAGAAPSNHTGFLSSLFPNIKFILVDPNPFDIYDANPIYITAKSIQTAIDGDDQLYIINDLFTIQLAKTIHKLIPKEQLYFISDIRTNIIDTPDALDILWNLSQQANWIYEMKPAKSMVKWRHPFYDEDPEIFITKSKESPYKDDFELSKKHGLDFIANYLAGRQLVYFDGIINLQAFPGTSSTETRLIIGDLSLVNWGDPTEYENLLFYYNSIARCYSLFSNNNADRKIGFDHCNDCAIENAYWKLYLKNYNSQYSVQDLVRKLSKITHRSLLRENHGHLFKGKYPLSKLIEFAKLYQENPDRKIKRIL